MVFNGNQSENVASRAYTKVFWDFIWWPSFWSNIFNLVWDFITANILTKFHTYQTKMGRLDRTQVFSKIWPSDLNFNLTWPILILICDFIETNISIKFHEYRTKNVASWVYTRILRFDQVTKFLTPHGPFSNSCEISSRQPSDQVSWVSDKKCGLYSVHKVFQDLTWGHSFWCHMTQFQTRPRFHWGKHSGQVSWVLDQNCGL